jgi:hypothetical protein
LGKRIAIWFWQHQPIDSRFVTIIEPRELLSAFIFSVFVVTIDHIFSSVYDIFSVFSPPSSRLLFHFFTCLPVAAATYRE